MKHMPKFELIKLKGRWPQRLRLEKILRDELPALLQPTFQKAGFDGPTMITIALLDDAAQSELNHQFRGKDKTTNVLSFPAANKKNLKSNLNHTEKLHLGDISLAYQCVMSEAKAQGKPALHHIIHLVIHGILHSLGYDHQTESTARRMEKLEREILAMMSIPDPYALPTYSLPARANAKSARKTART
jgi:probable rRNA maturation factor